MKICVLTSVYALSETDRHASFLVESHARLRARGHDVVVLAPSYEGLKSHVVDGVRVVRFRYFPAKWENLTHGEGAPNRVRNPFYFLMAFPYVLFGLLSTLRLVRREKPDMVHVQWPFPHGIWGVAAKWLSGSPMVCTFHGAEILLAERLGPVRVILRSILSRADAVTCNSSFTAGRVARLTGKPITVLPYGATIDPRDRMRPVGAPGPARLLFVGRLIPRKGLRYLVEAMSELGDATLDVVGDGPEGEACMALARARGVSDRITFHGFVDNATLERLYASADAFVLPSIVDDRGDTEGLGVVLIEAMAFRTPVVASAVGGIVDVVENEVSGLLVPEKSAQALAAAISRLLADPGLARALGDAGQRRGSEYFDWSRITDELESVYTKARSAR